MNHLTKAKAQLILDQPFFASLLFSMPLIEDKEIKTIATNGDEIRYNPEFVAKLTLPETIFVLTHETLHTVFHHVTRRGNRDANRWNMAADYVINNILVKENIGTMPKNCLYDPDMPDTAEEVYKLIPKEMEGKKPGNDHGNGGSLDDMRDAGKDEAERQEKENIKRVEIVKAARAAKAMGQLSKGLERLVNEATRSKADWKSILRNFMTERTKTDWSYAKPKRRFLGEDIYLPGMTGEKMESAVIAVDCSGSVSPELLSHFGAEIRGIIQDVAPTETHVLYFDSQILKHDKYSPDDLVEIKPIGGGGTDFRPIWSYLHEQAIDPACCIVLTDMYGRFGEAPEFPVLWAATTNEVAPFGDTVRIEA